MKLDILAIGAHPDDVELSCAGTLMKHIEMGFQVGILDLTEGELGSRGTVESRYQEAADASKIIGVSVRANTQIPDGFFENDKESKLRIIRYLRKWQPEIVLANALEDRHPDHGRAAKLVHEACFLSGLLKIETFDEQGNPQEKWRPKNLYHYIQDHNLTPDFVVDISPYFEQKMEAILAYKTQFYNPDNKGPQTPISSKSFFDFLGAKSRSYGRIINAEHGEGYNIARTPGVKNLFDLS